jgi:hypothetical protein
MMSYNKDEVINAIQLGISDGKKAFKRKRSINHSMFIFFVFLSSFTISVNMSDTFASSLIDVPVIGKIVEFVRIGSGFEEVAKQGLYTEGEILGETDNYIISVDGYYFSDTDVSILLSLETEKKPYTYYSIKNLIILDENYVPFDDYFIDYKNFDGYNPVRTEIVISRSLHLPETIHLEFDIERNKNFSTSSSGGYSQTVNEIETVFSHLEYMITKNVSKTERYYEINQSLKEDAIDVNINYMKIHPTTLDLNMDINLNDYIYNGYW